MAEKFYIVSAPYKQLGVQKSMLHSVKAEWPMLAAIKAYQEHKNFFDNFCNGEITVVEAKAGRLNTYSNFYDLDKVKTDAAKTLYT